MKGVRPWLDEHGIAPIGSIQVIHERPWSRVLRVAAADGALFLKQCEPVQAFEVPLTVTLAARWPDRMPEVVAADSRRGWLLLRDGGTRLRETGLESFSEALRLYGELQVGEAAHVEGLLRLGVPDVRLPVVAAAYERFFEHGRGLGEEELEQLRALAPRFRELCDELDAFGLPDSIQHDDLHDGNVFVRDGRSAILDWGDASVAHPLFSWSKALGAVLDRGLDAAPFRSAYLDPWRAVTSESRLLAALQGALTVGSFAYALQFQRQLDAMPAEVRPGYARYLPDQLRLLLARLGAP
jgi:hypothetical protein